MYLIFALPRSRTTWLANAMTHGTSVCHHDLSVDHDVAKVLLATGCGDADTGIVHLLHRLGPVKHVPAVVIHRNPGDVADSMQKLGFPGERQRLYEQAQALRTLEMRWDGPVLHVEYDDIDKRGSDIWTHCVGTGFDSQRWGRLCNMKVEAILDRERERYERSRSEKFTTYRT